VARKKVVPDRQSAKRRCEPVQGVDGCNVSRYTDFPTAIYRFIPIVRPASSTYAFIKKMEADMMKCWIAMLAGLAIGMMQAQAQLHEETLEYNQGGALLKGYLVYDAATTGLRPGVLVVPEWWGLNDYPKARAQQLARMGYIALAVDMYGNGKVASTPKEAGELATAIKANRQLMRDRINAGLALLKAQKMTDPKRIAAIGYCFGGTTVLELARSGAELAGVVSFHGALDTPNAADAKNIKCRVLVCHGADDPYEPTPQVLAFQDEMRQAKVDWQMIYYGNAVHSFTNPKSGSDNAKGAAYNELADHRSWEAMKAFFAEIFR